MGWDNWGLEVSKWGGPTFDLVSDPLGDLGGDIADGGAQQCHAAFFGANIRVVEQSTEAVLVLQWPKCDTLVHSEGEVVVVGHRAELVEGRKDLSRRTSQGDVVKDTNYLAANAVFEGLEHAKCGNGVGQ